MNRHVAPPIPITAFVCCGVNGCTLHSATQTTRRTSHTTHTAPHKEQTTLHTTHHTPHTPRRTKNRPHCTPHITHTAPHLGVKILRRQRQLYHSPPLPVAVKVRWTAALHRPWCDVDLRPWQIQHRLKRKRKRGEDERRGKRSRGRWCVRRWVRVESMCVYMGVCVSERVAAGSSTRPHSAPALL